MKGRQIPLLSIVLLALIFYTFVTLPSLATASMRHPEPYAYNSDYIFAATRGVQTTDMHPVAKVALSPVTIVIDAALLPFALTLGLFGY